MTNSVDQSSSSAFRGAIYLVLLGAAGFFLGIWLAVLGALVAGALLVVCGVFLLKRGREVQRLTRRSSGPLRGR